jgi:hypothetical protein
MGGAAETWHGSHNIGVGDGVLADLTTGKGNTCLGKFAGAEITTGNENAYLGYLTGYKNTTGYYNTGLGASALATVVTGAENTAVGADCLLLYTGDNATAVGKGALENATGRNDAFGRYAMNACLTGKDNCAFGVGSLNCLTTADCNCAFGYGALNKVIDGYYNVAVGYQALSTGQHCWHNTAVGTNALQINTADQCVGIGRSAGDSNTTGVGNTFLGYEADASAGNLASAMALGHNAIVGASNTCQIGAAATASADSVCVLFGRGLGMWAHAAPAAQPATPAGTDAQKIADIIAILQGMGACS